MQKAYNLHNLYLFNFSDVLPAFTCASVIGNIWSICLRLNISSHVAKSEGCKANICGRPTTFVVFIGNIPLLKSLGVILELHKEYLH